MANEKIKYENLSRPLKILVVCGWINVVATSLYILFLFGLIITGLATGALI